MKISRNMSIKKGAIHIGGHHAEERFWYEENGFKNVLWFEPDPNSYKIMLDLLKDFPGHTVYNVGAFSKNCEMPLHISSNDSMSSSILELKIHKKYWPEINYVNHIPAKFVRMDDFLLEHNINIDDYNLLSVDTPGVEFQVFRGFGNLLEKFDYIFAEVNTAELYNKGTLMIDIDIYLSKYGFQRSETYMSPNESGDAVYTKIKNN